nr:zinc finger, CCHC-type, retrotransposon Gag domain protein [Tanacetum cinerariifolium]
MHLLGGKPISKPKERLKREYHSIRQMNTETSTEFMQRFLRLVRFLGAAAGTEEEQAKNFQWGLRMSTLNHLMYMSYTDVAQVANAAHNYEILHERDDDDTEQKSGDRHQSTSQQSSHRSHGHNNDHHGSDRRGGSDNHRSSNNNYSGSNNRLPILLATMRSFMRGMMRTLSDQTSGRGVVIGISRPLSRVVTGATVIITTVMDLTGE